MQNSNSYNVRRFAECVRKKETVSITEVIEETGIAQQTAYRAARFLLKQKVICKVDKSDASFGRKADLYAINKSRAHLLGISVNKGHACVFVSNLCGKVVAKNAFETDDIFTLDEILQRIDENVRALMQRFFHTTKVKDKIALAGFIVSSDTDAAGRMVVAFNDMPFMNGFVPEDYVMRIYGIKCLLVRQTMAESAACIPQMQKNGIIDYIYLHIGSGIGANIVLDGRLYTGKDNRAGEISDALLPDGRTIEEALSTRTLTGRLSELAQGMPDSALRERIRTVLENAGNDKTGALMELLEAIAAEDTCPEISALLREFAKGWMWLLYYLSMLYAPEALAVGGQINESTPAILALLNEARARFEQMPDIYPIQFDDMYSMPAAIYFLDALFEEVMAEISSGA